MTLIRTEDDLLTVDASGSTLTLEQLTALSISNPHAQFLTPYGILLGGKVVADKIDVVSTAATPNTVVGRDAAGDVYMRGIVDAVGHLYALPLSTMKDSGDADCVLQEKITDLSTIREGAKKGATSVQKSGDTMTGTLIVPIVVGDLQGTSDFAKDLTGRIEATPEEFTFRPSAGDKSIRDESAVIRSIKGNSLVYNQQINYSQMYDASFSGIDFTVSNNKIIANGTATTSPSAFDIGWQCKKGHVYMMTGCPAGGSESTYKFYNQAAAADYGQGIIYTESRNGRVYNVIRISSGVTVNNLVFEAKIRDLTQMFGAGNEPTTVEEFYERMPQGVDLNAYNEGKIIDGNYEAIETVGFNQFNGEYAEVLPDETYYLGGTYSTIGFTDEIGGTTEAITIPADKLYIPTKRGYIYATGTNICINLSHTGVRDGEYEPYEKHTKELSVIQKYFPNGMRGAGSIYDEIRYNEESEQWEAVQRVGVVDLGRVFWASNTNADSVFFTGDVPNKSGINLLCSSYTTVNQNTSLNNMGDKTVKTHSSKTGYVYIKDSTYTDAATFKAAMQGVMLNYELVEPIITPITEPLQLDYWVEDFGTEKLISSGSSAPFKADIIYQFNATDRIRDNYRNIALLSKLKLDNPNGTSSQFIKGDGSLDSTTYVEQIVVQLSASGAIQREVYDKMIGNNVAVTFNVNSGQYVLKGGCMQIRNQGATFSTMFIDADDSLPKMVQISFTISDTSTAVQYQVAISNLIG